MILAVNLGESASLVRSFMDYYSLTFTVLLDTKREIGMMYNVQYIPTTYFIDRDGIIRDIKVGPFRNKAEIDWMLINTILEEEP